MNTRIKLLIGKQVFLYVLINILALVAGIAFINFSNVGENMMQGFIDGGPKMDIISAIFYYLFMFPFMIIIVILAMIGIVLLFVLSANVLYFTGLLMYYGKQKVTEETLLKEAEKLKSNHPEKTEELKAIESKLEKTKENSGSVGYVFKAIGIVIAFFIIKALLFSVIDGIAERIEKSNIEKKAKEMSETLDKTALDLPFISIAKPSNEIYYDYVTDKNNIWIVTNKSISSYDMETGKQMKSIPKSSITNDDMPISSIRLGAENALWLYNTNGIYKYSLSDGKVKTIKLPKNYYQEDTYIKRECYPLESNNHFFFYIDNNENIYLRLYKNYFNKWNGKRWSYFEIERDAFEDSDLKLFTLPNNNQIYAINYTGFPFHKNNGIYKVNTKDFSTTPYCVAGERDMSSKLELNAFPSYDGNSSFWFSGEKIYKLSPPNKVQEGLKINHPNFNENAIVKLEQLFTSDQNGNLYFYVIPPKVNEEDTTSGPGYILKYDSNKWSHYKLNKLSFNRPQIVRAENNRLLLINEESGIAIGKLNE